MGIQYEFRFALSKEAAGLSCMRSSMPAGMARC
jgi:hypothetical protein